MRSTNLRSSRPANSMEQDSFDSFDDVEDMLVMSTNNLNLTSNSGVSSSPSSTGGNRLRNQRDSSLNASGEEEDLPKSVVVTNVDMSIFDDPKSKSNFEVMLREYDQGATFHYLRSFRRIRIDFGSHLLASVAKQKLDNTVLGSNTVNCYFIQVLSPCNDGEAYLHVPPLQKQFLISPPCSPPVGWEQPREGKPIVDYDLLAAMAQLSPGKNHELHPPKEVTVLGKSISTPSIVVHVCGEEQQATGGLGKCVIKNTSRPDRQSSLD